MAVTFQPSHLVQLYEDGIICSGEVFSQFLDHVSQETLDESMHTLSAELRQRFRQNFGFRGEQVEETSSEDLVRRAEIESFMQGWLDQRYPEASTPS